MFGGAKGAKRMAGSGRAVKPKQPTPAAGAAPDAARPAPVEPMASTPAFVSPPAVGIRPAPNWPLLSAVFILLVALALRLAWLGSHVLQPVEAQGAFAAVAVLRGGDVGASPLLTFSQSLVFLLFGASDVTARIVPALVGSALVALPLLLRPELGVVGSRVAMLLLAVSPTLVHYSRRAEPTILVAALLVALVVCAWRARAGSPRYANAAAVALGLLLAAGPLAFVGLAAAVALLLVWTLGGGGEASAASAACGSWLGRSFLFGLGAWLVATTGALTSLDGVQAGLVDGLDAWLGGLVASGPRPSASVLRALVTNESLPILLAVFAVTHRKGKPGATALVALALLTFGIGSLGVGDSPTIAALMVPPLALVGGLGGAQVLSAVAGSSTREDVVGVALVGTSLLAGATIALNHVTTAQPYVPDAILVAPLVLIGGAAATFIGWRSARRTVPALAAFAFVALLLFTWRGAALAAAPGLAPDGLYDARVSSPDVRTLADDVGIAVRAKARMGQPSWPVTLSPSVAWPALWYLRDLPGVEVREPGDDRVAVAILPGDAKPPRGSYAGLGYQIAQTASGSPTGWKSVWRWLAFRESPDAPVPTQVNVFVRGANDR